MNLIGNDIVDLSLPGTLDKAKDLRFLRRVFSDFEQDQIAACPRPSYALWAFWAAKEAAFKVLQKLDPHLIFAHKCFEVRTSPRNNGYVSYQGHQLPVLWCLEHAFIHSTCTLQEAWDETALEISQIPTGANESLWARSLALSLLKQRGIEATTIRRAAIGNRLGPPVAERNGKQICGVDISLSHDGRYVAACFLPSHATKASASLRAASAQ